MEGLYPVATPGNKQRTDSLLRPGQTRTGGHLVSGTPRLIIPPGSELGSSAFRYGKVSDPPGLQTTFWVYSTPVGAGPDDPYWMPHSVMVLL
jgi:hypothetical protein